MTNQTEFTTEFEGLQTIGDVDKKYKQLFHETFGDSLTVMSHPSYWPLAEAHRKAHEQIVFERDNKTRTTTDESGKTVNRISSRIIQNWALLAGVPTGRRISHELENKYREAHDMPILLDKGMQRAAEVAERKAERAQRKLERQTLASANRIIRESVTAPTGDVRRWARDNGFECGDRGRIHPSILEAYIAATEG